MTTFSKMVISEADLANETLKLDRERYVLDAKTKASRALSELWPGVFATYGPGQYSVHVQVDVLPELMGVRATQVSIRVTRIHNLTGSSETRTFHQDQRMEGFVPLRHREPSERNQLLCQVIANINAY